ncbi:MAG: translation initiation factor IF-2 [Thermodesulfobacteriota bacterium]
MAKLRVYELARELNMTNKDLMDLIQTLELEAPVKSHTSGLEDEIVVAIKAAITGPKKQNVDEKRIGERVIRRRRKAVEAEPELEAEAAAPAEAEALEPEELAPAEAEPPAPEPPLEETPAPVAAEQPAEPAEAPPPVQEPEPASPVAEAAPAPEAAPQAPAVEPEKPAEALPTAEAAPAPEPTPEPETPAESQAAAPAASAAAATAAEEEAKAKGRKKKKKETAARIISLPDKPVTPTLPGDMRSQAASPSRPATTEAAASEDDSKDRKKKKSKKKDEPQEADSLFFKKKISFRKKEVVEGADLYDQDTPRMRKQKKGKGVPPRPQKPAATMPKAIKRRIRVDEAIALADLAKRMGVKAAELIKKLLAMGQVATINQVIDYDTAALLASEFEYEVERAAFVEEDLIKTQAEKPESMVTRPPVVTIMGHVDHGKTSLLDAIRETRVTEGEAGGITQHIGAYLVEVERGNIAFLDTPGHEAFTAMRARGAKVTDIVVLVVAADDGVMPQTVEAIHHSRAANVPIIVAVNKMDKPGADPDRVMRELSDQGLVPEKWGGDTIFAMVSAKQRMGIEELLEMILLQAEVMELTADPDRPARGHVVEAKMDPGRGPVATVLIQEGTLKAGDSVVCGVSYGKVRAMQNDRGEPQDLATPSYPVEIVGLSGVPMAGDELISVENEKVAKEISYHRSQKQRQTELAKTARPSLENLFARMQETEVKELGLIIKADVQGSVEALRESLEKLSGTEVRINVIYAATGAVTESDVNLAAVSGALIISFNVRANAKVMEAASAQEVEIRYYDIIYNVIDDVKAAIVGMMKSTFEERVSGRAEVRNTFTIPKIGTIAGCHVQDGKAERGAKVRLVRDGIVVYNGKVSSLRRFKDDVKEVAAGYECGVGLENYNDIKVGDILEFYYLEEIKPTLQ